jgi:hypothetical protein
MTRDADITFDSSAVKQASQANRRIRFQHAKRGAAHAETTRTLKCTTQTLTFDTALRQAAHLLDNRLASFAMPSGSRLHFDGADGRPIAG